MAKATEYGDFSTAAGQLDFIESTMREGRKSTEYWGWTFVLWGVAYLVAMGWSGWLTNSRSAIWAWPVTMTATGLATYLIARWRNGGSGNVSTTRSRAVMGVWMGVGFGIFLFAFPLVWAGRFSDGHAFLGGIEILLGVAHVTSGIILRWRLQMGVGLVWWAAALVSETVPGGLWLGIAFIIATVLCNLCFGTYLMVREARDKARLRTAQVSHA